MVGRLIEHQAGKAWSKGHENSLSGNRFIRCRCCLRGLGAAHGICFGAEDSSLGGARVLSLPDGSIVGVRAPLHESETPVVRPYWLVDNIESALAEAGKQGADVIHPPLEIPGRGTFAIYIQGSVQHGLWQL